MKRAAFSLPSFRVPSFHFKRKPSQTQTDGNNADNCPACRSTQLRRTHAIRQRVQSVASFHFLPSAKWKDEGPPPPPAVQWKCKECGWIGVKGGCDESNSLATSPRSHTTNLSSLTLSLSPVSPVSVTPAVPWQQYEHLSTPTAGSTFPVGAASPSPSFASLPATAALGSSSSNSNLRAGKRHRVSRSLSPRSAWHKFTGSFGGNGSPLESTANASAIIGGRPAPITEMNPLYQAAEKWHRPPSFIFQGINGTGEGSGAGQVQQAEGRGRRVPKWMYVN